MNFDQGPLNFLMMSRILYKFRSSIKVSSKFAKKNSTYNTLNCFRKVLKDLGDEKSSVKLNEKKFHAMTVKKLSGKSFA